jgi:hypothetical protein
MNNDWHDLIQRYIAGLTTEDESEHLQESLKRDDSLARLYLRYMNLDVTLEAHANSSIAIKEMLVSSNRVEAKHLHFWLAWSPLAAAAAGIVFGMICTSVVFAHTAPRTVNHLLDLANTGFEEAITPLPDGIPKQYGVWSGDYSSIVGEEMGVIPHEGRHMLKFLRSDSAEERLTGNASNGNLYQIVDLRTWRNEIASGTSIVDWSAWFNAVPTDAEAKLKFVARVWAYGGEPSLVRKGWEEKMHLELAYSSRNIAADTDVKSWQRIAGSMIVPQDTNFLVIELKAVAGEVPAKNKIVTFAGDYVDDVNLILRTSGNQQPITVSQE